VTIGEVLMSWRAVALVSSVLLCPSTANAQAVPISNVIHCNSQTGKFRCYFASALYDQAANKVLTCNMQMTVEYGAPIPDKYYEVKATTGDGTCLRQASPAAGLGVMGSPHQLPNAQRVNAFVATDPAGEVHYCIQPFTVNSTPHALACRKVSNYVDK
jgi:hypothetical protein